MTKFVSLFLLSAFPAFATVISLSSTSTGPSITTNTDLSPPTLVPNNSLVRVGMLTTAGDASTFVEFGTAAVKSAGALANARASKLNSSVANATEADDSPFDGKPIYVWIYNSTTVSTTADQGLFKSSSAFPTNDGAAGINDSLTVAVTSFTETVPIAGFKTAAIQSTADNLTGNATGGRFVLGAQVPEPTSFALASIALLGLVGKRRR